MRSRSYPARLAITVVIAIIAILAPRGVSNTARATQPSWLGAATIYDVYPEIFSSSGNLAAVTAQLNRIRNLGFNAIYLMPVTTPGQPCTVDGTAHPAFDSPYAVHDYYSINPKYGAGSDLTNLITTAHNLGMKVILDEVLNHTSWDNALITGHPEYYVHSDGNAYNVGSIEEAFNFADVAQLNYSTTQYGLQTYITNMLEYWMNTYGVDGFRFDTADDPSGPNRMIPQSFWESLQTSLQSVNPNILMLGEENDNQLMDAPFEMDYGWTNQSQLVQATTSGDSTSGLESVWSQQLSSSYGWPANTIHMTLLQDWDLPEDLQEYGGIPNTLDAAVYNFTTNGVPLLSNGEEIGNDNSGNNTHNVIDWASPNATKFTAFYSALVPLRDNNPSLQQGAETWESNTDSNDVATYDRSGGSSEFLIEINFSGSSQSGTLSAPPGSAWTDVSVSGSPGGTSHVAPPNFSLLPYDFAIFERTNTAPAAPTNLAASPGNAQVSLAWTASSGAASYNIYRGTSAGGESGTAVATGVTVTSYTNTGLTNGTKYYYKVAAENGVGTSGYSNEASATPVLPVPAAPTGLAATAGNGLVALTWSASSGAASYNVYRGTSAGGESGTAIAAGITTTTYTNTGLSNGTAYYYKVAAVNSAGTSGYSNEASATPTAPPAAPSGLTASAGNSQVALAWSASAGAASYDVYQGTSAGGEGSTAVATGITSTSHTVTSLTVGTKYYFKVAAVNAAGTSSQSNEASATPTYGGTPYGGTAAAIPGVVQDENYDLGGEGVAYHDSDASNNGGAYRTSDGVDIESSSDTGGGYDVGWNNAGEWQKYTVTIATTGTYSVAFRVSSGESDGSSGTFHLENQAGTNLTGEITVGGTGGWQAWVTKTGSAALTAGSNVLRMVVDSGQGEYSINSMSFTLNGVPSAPTGLTGTAGNAQVALSWTASSGAASYNLYRGTTAGGESGTAIATGISGTTYTNTGLTNGTKYYYKVAAVNSSGTSAMSNEASATPATGETPYTGGPYALPGTVDFDNFDNGGQGVAYNDSDTSNNGGAYRTTEGVDIEACTDSNGIGNGYDVGWTQPGEWDRYTVNASTAKTYSISFRVASGIASGTAGTFHIQNSAGTNLTGEITVSSTGGWQTWTTLSGSAVLPAGQQVLQLDIDSGNGAFNVEYMTFN